jgi:methionyl-tRNA formyltransferase
VAPTATAGDLLSELSVAGADLLGEVVDAIAVGSVSAVEQTGEPTFAPKLTIDDARIDWTQSADAVANRIRGVTPEPGAFTTIGDARLKVLGVLLARDVNQQPGHIHTDGHRILVGTGTHALELLSVQPAGKKAMNALDWWRGLPTADVVAS